MNALYTLAQYYTTYDYRPLTEEEAVAVGALTGVFILVALIFSIVAYVIGALLLSRVFKKAGVPAWAAWVPFYNNWKLLEIGGQQGFWAVLAIIPVVNIVSVVFMYISLYNIGLKFGKSGAFVLWAIFLPIVWLIWLAVDKSTWNEKAAGAARSVAPEHRKASA